MHWTTGQHRLEKAKAAQAREEIEKRAAFETWWLDRVRAFPGILQWPTEVADEFEAQRRIYQLLREAFEAGRKEKICGAGR